MKRSVLTLSALTLLTAGSAFAVAPAASGKYQIDPSHSKVGFEISHLVVSSVEGRFNTHKGELVVGDKPEKLEVNSEIETASIDTGIADRDKHLRSPDFFDVEKFPKITFKSKKVTGSPEKLKIVGDLTIHGVTKEVTLDGKFKGAVKGMYGEERVAYEANTKIKRKDFGLNWGKLVEAGPVVGDEVTISLKVEATKQK